MCPGPNSQAPVGVMTVFIRGNVMLRTPAITRENQVSTAPQKKKTHVSPESRRRVRCCPLSMLTKGVVDGHGPGHALLTLDRGEDLGRVLEGHGALAQRVGNGEEVDESVLSVRQCLLCIPRRGTEINGIDSQRAKGVSRNLQDNGTNLLGSGA